MVLGEAFVYWSVLETGAKQVMQRVLHRIVRMDSSIQTFFAVPACLKIMESKLGQQQFCKVQHTKDFRLNLGGQAEDVRVVLQIHPTHFLYTAEISRTAYAATATQQMKRLRLFLPE